MKYSVLTDSGTGTAIVFSDYQMVSPLSSNGLLQTVIIPRLWLKQVTYMHTQRANVGKGLVGRSSVPECITNVYELVKE